MKKRILTLVTARLLCLVMIFSELAVFPANATLDLGGGGGGGVISITYTCGDQVSSAIGDCTDLVRSNYLINLRSNPFTDVEYPFLYWSDGKGNRYADQATAAFFNNVTLTAVWDVPVAQSSIMGADCNITYSPAMEDNDPGGYIEVAWDGSLYSTVTVVPHITAGYYVNVEFTAADGSMIIAMQNTSTGEYSFAMPASDVTITATFARKSYKIDLECDHATVVGLPQRATVGDTVAFTVEPDDGYRISGVYLDDALSGQSLLPIAIGCYSFVMPDRRPTVTVTAEAITSEITYDLVGGGTYEGPATAAYGDYVYVSLSTGDGYEFASCSVTAASGSAVPCEFSTGELCGTVGFTMPAEPVTVHVVRRHMPYRIVYDIGDGVTLDSAPDWVYEGGEVTVSYTVDTGYAVSDISITGENVSETFDSNPFTFTMPGTEVEVHISTQEVHRNITKTVIGPGSVIAPSSAQVGSEVTVYFNGDLLEYSLRTASGDDIPHDGEPPWAFDFEMPDEDVVITARFLGNIQYIEYYTDARVTLVSAPASAREGEEVTVSYTVAEGYEVRNVFVDGDRFGEIFSSNPFSFTMPDCSVNIEFEVVPKTYSVDLNVIGESGHATCQAPESAEFGEQVQFTASCESGYRIEWIHVTPAVGENITYYVGDNDTYSFVMPASDVTVTVKIARNTYDIEYDSDDSVEFINMPTSAAWGDNVSISLTVADGYKLDQVVVRDAVLTKYFYTNSFSFTMPKSTVSITVETSEVRVDISASVTGEGSASFPSDARPGENVTVTFTPANGHAVGAFSLTCFGGAVAYTGDPADGAVSFIMPDHTVNMTIRFYGAEHAVNYSYNSDCVHLVSAPATAHEGEEVTVSVTVDEGCLLNCAQVSDGASYNETFYTWDFTFTMPDSDVDVTLTETQVQYTVSKSFSCDGGSVECTKETAHVGEEVAFVISFDDPDDYMVTGVEVKKDSGETLELIPDLNVENRYYFTMPSENVTVFAQAAEATAVTFLPNGANGNASKVKIARGGSVTMPSCEFWADDGWFFAGWGVGSTVYKPGDLVSFSSHTAVNALWNKSSALCVGVSQENGALSVALYVETFSGEPQDHSLMISGSDGTFEYTLDDAGFEQVVIDGKTLCKYPVELTATMIAEGFAYVVDDLDANGDWIMAGAGVFTFTVDETAAALAVSIDDYDTGVTQIQPTNGSFFFTVPPFGPEINVTYAPAAPAILWGDANGDGTVDTLDLTLIRCYLANYDYDTNTSTVDIEPGADANGDGATDTRDLTLIRRYLANFDYDTNTSTVVLGPQP